MKTELTYRICLEGHLDDEWENYFCGFDIFRKFNSVKKPVTIIKVLIRDQAELFGIISRIRDLGMTLIHLNQICVEVKNGEIY